MNLKNLNVLYNKAIPSKRTGSMYNAFSYPTKISPEVIALFISCHTKPGDSILDTFGGSGTTGLAAHLCSNPTEDMIKMADNMNLEPQWGPRKAYIYELSTIGSYVADNLCNPPESELFEKEALNLLERVEKNLGWMYEAEDPQGNKGVIRHVIWNEVLICNNCYEKSPYLDVMINEDPLYIKDKFVCKKCGFSTEVSKLERDKEIYYDNLLNEELTRKKRIMSKVYGQTGQKKWSRKATEKDKFLFDKIEHIKLKSFPIKKIVWGDLFRSGYHFGISHVHHFYTARNRCILSTLINEIDNANPKVRDALKMWILSYNASHSTLMTRVVTKKSQKDFVITGAQSGVQYISNLPVEKNMIIGLKRKIKVYSKSFDIVNNSKSEVTIINKSSTLLNELKDESINYVFTDPPFGDYIPYSELNYLNEVWLDCVTETKEEVIINRTQNKGLDEYKELMVRVFLEIERVLKDKSNVTLVFHSAKADVWNALKESFSFANFNIVTSSVLDKLQGSFKQVSSQISVKGDPLILLEKSNNSLKSLEYKLDTKTVIQQIVEELMERDEEVTNDRIFSRFINYCLESNLVVPYNANDFYKMVNELDILDRQE